MKKHGILFIAAFSLFVQLHSQDVNQVIEFARSEYSTGNYPTAIKEFQRAMLFGDPSIRPMAYRYIADSYFATGEYADAIELYDHLVTMTDDMALSNSHQLKKILCEIMLEQFQYALIDIYSLSDSLAEDQYRQYQLYSGICFFRLEDFSQAEVAFQQALGNDRDAIKELESLFKDEKRLLKPKPGTAQVLSIILPGSGQFYAGDLRNGFNSLILNGLLGFLTVSTAINYSFLDALITILPWFQRYYQGGYTRAAEIARVRRDEKREAVYQEILDLVEGTVTE